MFRFFTCGCGKVVPDDSISETVYKETILGLKTEIEKLKRENEKLQSLSNECDSRRQRAVEAQEEMQSRVAALEKTLMVYQKTSDSNTASAVAVTENVTAETGSQLKRADNVLVSSRASYPRSDNHGTIMSRFDEAADEDEVMLAEFNAIDGNGDGFISKEELADAFKRYGDDEMVDALRNLNHFVRVDFEQFRTVTSRLTPTELKETSDSGREEALQTIFHTLDKDRDGYITADEVARGISLYESDSGTRGFAEALKAINFADMTRIDLPTFKQFFLRFPRPRGIRVAWARSLRLDEALARHLRRGNIFDGFKGIKDMSKDDLNEAMARFYCDLPGIVLRAHDELTSPASGCATASEANSKFSMEAGAFKGKFAPIEMYYKGSEALVGTPNPNLEEGVRKEHTLRADADTFFLAPNYQICTCPRLEHQFVEDPDSLEVHPNVRRYLRAHGDKYPGEVGFRHRETSLRVRVRGAAGHRRAALGRHAVLMRRLVEAGVVDQGSEEEARGLQLRAEAEDVESAEGDLCLVLPLSAEQVQANEGRVLDAFAAAAEVERGALEVVSRAETTYEHCQFVAGADLRDFLLRMASSEEFDEWCRETRHTGLSREARVEAAMVAFDAETEAWQSANKRRRLGRKREGSNRRIMDTKQEMIRKSQLSEPEFKCLRLYTSSMYLFYNSVPRRFPQHILDKLQGNKYETTLFCINSGLLKLSKITPVPENRLVYRGLGGMLLPSEFWIPQGEPPWRGGVEFGLMSTTTDRSVAIQYSGSNLGRGIVMEISTGRIDIGASLQWLSMFPGEAEFLYPMLSCLEVMGEPRIEFVGGREIIVFPLKVNSNVKGLTAEELIERRKNLHSATAKNLREEIEIEAYAMLDSFQAIAGDGQQSSTIRFREMVEMICRDVAEFFRREHDTIDPKEFNNDEEFKRLTSESVDAKILSIAKLAMFSDVLQDQKLAPEVKEAQLRRIQQMHFKKFADRSVRFQIRSGVEDFPWGELIDRKVIMDLGDWTPVTLSRDQRQNLTTEIACHNTINGIASKGHVLNFKYNEDCSMANLSHQSAVKEIGYQAVFILAANQRLTSLDLRGNNLGLDAWTSIMAALEGAKSLCVLNGRACEGLFSGRLATLNVGYLQGQTFADDPGFALSLVPWLSTSSSSLVDLNMGSNKLGTSDPRAMEQMIPQLSKLEVLDLSENEFGSQTGSSIASVLGCLGFLKDLNLSCNGLDATAATALGEVLKSLGTLKTINLWGNPFGPTGGAAIAAALPSLSQLQDLYLGSCELEAAGALAAACAVARLPAARTLGLGYNRVGDAGLVPIAEALAARPGAGSGDGAALSTLDLDGNGASSVTVARVRKLFSASGGAAVTVLV